MRTRKPARRKARPSSREAQAATLAAIAKSFQPALPRKRQEALRSRGRRMPNAVILRLAEVAARARNGVVAGSRFDAKAARESLARVEHLRAMAKAARLLSRRAESEAVRTFVLAADRTTAVTVALRRVVRTPEGAPFRALYEEVRALVRAKRNGG